MYSRSCCRNSSPGGSAARPRTRSSPPCGSRQHLKCALRMRERYVLATVRFTAGLLPGGSCHLQLPFLNSCINHILDKRGSNPCCAHGLFGPLAPSAIQPVSQPASQPVGSCLMDSIHTKRTRSVDTWLHHLLARMPNVQCTCKNGFRMAFTCGTAARSSGCISPR